MSFISARTTRSRDWAVTYSRQPPVLSDSARRVEFALAMGDHDHFTMRQSSGLEPRSNAKSDSHICI